MSEPSFDADKIRNKRLAKLQQQQEQVQQQGEQSRAADTQDEPTTQSQKPVPVTTPLSKPLKTATSTTSTSRITITPQKREMNGNERPTARSTEPIEQWEDRTIRSIFRLTLDSTKTRDIHGAVLHYLPGLEEELKGEGKETRLTIDILEQAIMEAGSALGKVTPHDWLFACWKRVSRAVKVFKDKSSENQQWHVLQEAQRLCMSWCLFSVTTPEVFNTEYDGVKALADHLLADPDDERGVCNDFLVHAVQRFQDDETVKDIFVSAMESLSLRLAGLSMDSNYRSYLGTLRSLVQFPQVAIALSESSMFLPTDVSAADLEVKTLLGPYFQLSPLQDQTTRQYFPGPKTMDSGRIKTAQTSMQMALRAHQEELFMIIDKLVRTSAEVRERVLDWLALSVNLNHKRRAMRVEKTTVSSDGYMININVVLDRLCEPFMDARFSKIDRVDIDYLRRNPRLDVKDETKINADQEQSDQYYAKSIEGKNNFVSEIFFLTVASHHYGIEAARNMLKDMDRELDHMAKQIEVFETERHKYINNPAQLQIFENALKRYKDQHERGLAYKHAVQGVLMDDTTQTRSMQFMRFVTTWLLRQVSEHKQFPAKPMKLPLAVDQPEAFKFLPEYFIDVISGNFGFIMHNMPQVISPTQSDELIMLCITFLRSSAYIRNPYLKASLITILYRGTWKWRQGGAGILSDMYNSMPYALEHLLHALMNFFIESEFLGGNSQFYDKFTVRFEIFQIIKCIWPNEVYRNNLLKEAKVNLDFFVRFVNLLLNDVTYVLDESFTAFHTIYDLQKELATSGTTIDEQQRQEKEEQLERAKGKAKSFMDLTNETVHVMKLFTEALADAFTMPEVVQRLADMLNYNLDAMVPPKSSSLKVDNLAEYHFEPKKLLSEIIDIYLNLSGKENFILAIARDGRSYKPANFVQAGDLVKKHVLKSPKQIAEWNLLIAKFAKAKEEDEAAEGDLGEIPDEFLDPLMYTLMEDPVILPVSRTIIDRSTIRSHLLSNPHDPFNRVPLKIEDVIPADDVREKIQRFKEERLGGRKKEFEETVKLEDSMDTTMG